MKESLKKIIETAKLNGAKYIHMPVSTLENIVYKIEADENKIASLREYIMGIKISVASPANLPSSPGPVNMRDAWADIKRHVDSCIKDRISMWEKHFYTDHDPPALLGRK